MPPQHDRMTMLKARNYYHHFVNDYAQPEMPSAEADGPSWFGGANGSVLRFTKDRSVLHLNYHIEYMDRPEGYASRSHVTKCLTADSHSLTFRWRLITN